MSYTTLDTVIKSRCSRNKQMSRQLELRCILQNATIDDNWKYYISPESTSIIRNFGYWSELQRVRDDSRIYQVTIKKFQCMLIMLF